MYKKRNKIKWKEDYKTKRNLYYYFIRPYEQIYFLYTLCKFYKKFSINQSNNDNYYLSI